jgi:hypothetical protein
MYCECGGVPVGSSGATYPCVLIGVQARVGRVGSFGFSDAEIEFDSPNRFVLLCAYTGKEVVGCKVQILIVVALPDQVRWLRLRAVALRGVPVDPLVGESRDILSQTIREYGLNHASHVVPRTGVSEGPRRTPQNGKSSRFGDPVE